MSAAMPDLIKLVRGEYLEVQGLNLRKDQLRDLWDLDASTCDVLIDALVDLRFLCQTPAGTYIRAISARV